MSDRRPRVRLPLPPRHAPLDTSAGFADHPTVSATKAAASIAPAVTPNLATRPAPQDVGRRKRALERSGGLFNRPHVNQPIRAVADAARPSGNNASSRSRFSASRPAEDDPKHDPREVAPPHPGPLPEFRAHLTIHHATVPESEPSRTSEIPKWEVMRAVMRCLTGKRKSPRMSGASRRTVDNWLARYERFGLEGLVSMKSPDGPRQIPDQVRSRFSR
jgi:hypothetical protein